MIHPVKHLRTDLKAVSFSTVSLAMDTAKFMRYSLRVYNNDIDQIPSEPGAFPK